ncbi:uncharacterized protein MYCFIDRAFT_176414 [Pseudocercospora fijiensis CIRAD86]|uniref:Uncharacterized protein n=1 Tax=Pseudocercospora fijiensis (strain CIRAD86) TaxID=383855 RepID=M3AVA7_PSEFD|nr:uncharacterized protein MYCFIDRAFT_176414 [Pseudocercospora fijiensis CIRAD86]EME81093.1 hypothetical protein MYCFIDRAFT_176414 [Pseudocercospora fijiensis CIRAD86]
MRFETTFIAPLRLNTKNAAKGSFKLTIEGTKAYSTPSTGRTKSTTISNSGPSPSTFRFLDLPGEMRNDVYKILLTHNKAAGLRASPSILQVNHQIHSEASGFIYSESVATIKIFSKYMGGVVVQGDIVDNLYNSRHKVPLVNDSTSALEFDDPISKYSALWPVYLSQIPHIKLEIHFDDSANNVDTSNSTWFASDLSPANRCLYSLVSYLMNSHGNTSSTKISGRVSTLDINIHATELQNPNLSRAWEILLYPLTKIPKIYTLRTNLSPETNILNARSSPSPEISANLLAHWPTIRPLATLSLNLTSHFAKPSTSHQSRTRYASTLLATSPTAFGMEIKKSEALNLTSLISLGRLVFQTLKFGIEDKACIFDRRADVRMTGLMGVLAECVLTLRGFDDHVGAKGVEKAKESALNDEMCFGAEEGSKGVIVVSVGPTRGPKNRVDCM